MGYGRAWHLYPHTGYIWRNSSTHFNNENKQFCMGPHAYVSFMLKFSIQCCKYWASIQGRSENKFQLGIFSGSAVFFWKLKKLHNVKKAVN